MDVDDLLVCGISYVGLSSSVLHTKQKALGLSFSHSSHKGLFLMHKGQTLLAAVWSPRTLSDVESVSTLRPHDGQCPQAKPSSRDSVLTRLVIMDTPVPSFLSPEVTTQKAGVVAAVGKGP